MDGRRFDDFVRALSAGASRRRVLRGLAAGATGALAGALGPRRAGAQTCPTYGRVCRPGGLSDPGCCTPGAECRCYANGHCRCLCPEGSSFVDGACVSPCPPPRLCPGSAFPGGCCPEGCACIDVGVCSCPV